MPAVGNKVCMIFNFEARSNSPVRNYNSVSSTHKLTEYYTKHDTLVESQGFCRWVSCPTINSPSRNRKLTLKLKDSGN